MQELHIDSFDSVCRVCFATTSLSSMFEIYCQDKCITDILWECTSIKINKSDALPKNICMNCVQSLCNAYNFITLAKQTDNILVNMINDGTNSVQNEENEEQIIIKIEVDETSSQLKNIADDDLSLVHKTKKFPKLYCKECNNEFHGLFEFSHHFKSVIHIKKFDLLCPVCDKNFTTPQSFSKHLQNHAGWYRCNLCDKKFNFIANLQKHMMVHNGMNFICDSCGKAFKSAWFFHEHISLHSKQKWCTCQKCGKQFSSYCEYFSHLQKHDLKIGHRIIHRYNCIFCNKICKSFCVLKLHMKNCRKIFKTESNNISDENMTVEKKNRCDLCQKDFKTKYTYENHLKLHNDDKPYLCECGKTFRLQYNLKVHQRIHTGEKPYMCHVCNRCFAQKQQLNTHFRTHTLERPYQCHYCDKTFATRGNATVHMRLHTGETPFICEICSRGYVDSSGLKRHKCTFTVDPLLIYDINSAPC